MKTCRLRSCHGPFRRSANDCPTGPTWLEGAAGEFTAVMTMAPALRNRDGGALETLRDPRGRPYPYGARADVVLSRPVSLLNRQTRRRTPLPLRPKGPTVMRRFLRNITSALSCVSVLTLAIPASSHAQDGRIAGMVRTANGTPLSNARITVV